MKNKVFLTILFISLLTACKSKENVSTSDISFFDMYPNIEFGKIIELRKALDYETQKPFIFSQGDDILLDIHNKSKKTILFPPDFGISIYISNHDKWVTIDNLVTYYSSEEGRTLKSKTDVKYQPGFVTVLPAIERQNKTIEVRIVIIGNILDGNTALEEVGSYIDIELQP